MTFEEWWAVAAKQYDDYDDHEQGCRAAWEVGQEQEREACAALVENPPNDCYEEEMVSLNLVEAKLAAVIRARGQAANPISGTEPADGTVSPT